MGTPIHNILKENKVLRNKPQHWGERHVQWNFKSLKKEINKDKENMKTSLFNQNPTIYFTETEKDPKSQKTLDT